MNQRTKELLHYIIPSAGALCVTYLYNIVDGIFIGQGVGHLALAAVNITVPFITVMIAISILFAMGGSTVIAIRLGRKDHDGANDAFMTSMFLLLILSIMLLVFGTVFAKQIVLFSGASKATSGMATDYLFYYTLFAIPFLFSNCLSIFVRNDDAPRLAFVGMTCGALANVFLDWLFIFPFQMGVKGAAIASGLGQVLALLILMSHFFRKKGYLRIRKFKLSAALIKKVSMRGLPEFISQLNTPVTIFCYNLVLTRTLGDMGVATFSVLSFLYSIANAILSGIAEGIQPLWGRAFGQKDAKGLRSYLKTGFRINLGCSVVIYALFCIFRVQSVEIFNSDPTLIQMSAAALPVFALSFVFMAVNYIITTYFYSTKQTNKSNLIAVCRGIVVKALAIFLVPLILGSSFVWWGVVIAEGISMIIAFICLKYDKNPARLIS